MKRSSGVLMHISSLFGDYSEGSFGSEAKEFIDFLYDCGFSYWQTLPFLSTDDHNSPYSSPSAFSCNPFFIDLPTLYERSLITREELNDARQKHPYSCEFDRLHSERMELLAKAAMRCTETDKIEAFISAHKSVGNFCRFMAIKHANKGKPWSEWDNDTPDENMLNTWRFIAYEFMRQWEKIRRYANDRGIKIIGDIPIYVSYDSSDVWANPDLFLLGDDMRPEAVAGVPPDYFCADGQLWGNPLYDFERMKKDGYAWWRERISFMCEIFDGVRIDHFRAFESYYSIPAQDKNARGGKWVKGPGMELISVIKDAAKDSLIIAEDLGDITPEVHKLVADSGFPGMRVLQFAFLGDEKTPHLPHNFSDNCVAYTGTHDNNTLLGYVWECDDAQRARLFEYCGHTGDIHTCYDAIYRTMFASHAPLFIMPIQDLLLYGSDTRLNKPGTSDDNWSYRITREQLAEIDRSKFRRYNILYGRI